eukprot:gene8177-biopygen18105
MQNTGTATGPAQPWTAVRLMIALRAGVRVLHSEPKTRARAKLALGLPFPPAKWRPREAMWATSLCKLRERAHVGLSLAPLGGVRVHDARPTHVRIDTTENIKGNTM